MKRVGVVVEGPSDLMFWHRLLGRMFSSQGWWFDIRNLKGGDRVIQQAPELANAFRKAGYHSAIFIVDADKAPCPTTILARFDERFLRDTRSQPPASRFAHVFVAVRELESWVLADEECMRLLLEFPGYQVPAAGAPPAGKAKLLRLCREHGAAASGMQDHQFARQAAGGFDPLRASEHSPSFAHFWERLTARLANEAA